MDKKDFSQYTTRELLNEVNNAIGRIMVGGQSYRLGNLSLTRADLGMLRNLKKDLTAELAAEGGAGTLPGFCAAVFDGR